MQHLEQLLSEIKNDFSILEEEKKTLEDKLSALNQEHRAQEQTLNSGQEKGFAEKFKNALGLKRNVEKEIKDTQDTLNYVNSLIAEKINQYQVNGVIFHQAVTDAARQDTELLKQELEPTYSEIKEHLGKVIELYQNIGAQLEQKTREQNQIVAELRKYTPRDRQNWINAHIGIANPNYTKDELIAFCQANFE